MGDMVGLTSTRLPLAGISRAEDDKEHKTCRNFPHEKHTGPVLGAERVVGLVPTPIIDLPNVDGVIFLDRDALNRQIAVVIKDHRFRVAKETGEPGENSTWEIVRELPMRPEFAQAADKTDKTDKVE